MSTHWDTVIAAASSYEARHQGRRALPDAISGAVTAVYSSIKKRLDEQVPKAAAAAMRGGFDGDLLSLDPWERWLLTMKWMLVCAGEANDDPESLFGDREMLQQIIHEPSLPKLGARLAMLGKLRARGAEISSIPLDCWRSFLNDSGCGVRWDSEADQNAILALLSGEDAGAFKDEMSNVLIADAKRMTSLLKKKRPPHRTADPVWRGFYDGVVLLYANADGNIGLGLPTARDLGELATVCGFDRTPAAAEPLSATIERWRKRLELIPAAHTQQILASRLLSVPSS